MTRSRRCSYRQYPWASSGISKKSPWISQGLFAARDVLVLRQDIHVLRFFYEQHTDYERP